MAAEEAEEEEVVVVVVAAAVEAAADALQILRLSKDPANIKRNRGTAPC